MYMATSSVALCLIVIVVLLYFRKTFKRIGATLEPTLPVIATAIAENAKVYGIESHADNLQTVQDRREELAARGLQLSMTIDELVNQPITTRNASNIDDSIV